MNIQQFHKDHHSDSTIQILVVSPTVGYVHAIGSTLHVCEKPPVIYKFRKKEQSLRLAIQIIRKNGNKTNATHNKNQESSSSSSSSTIYYDYLPTKLTHKYKKGGLVVARYFVGWDVWKDIILYTTTTTTPRNKNNKDVVIMATIVDDFRKQNISNIPILIDPTLKLDLLAQLREWPNRRSLTLGSGRPVVGYCTYYT